MEPFMQPPYVFAFTAWLLLQLLNEPHYTAYMAVTGESDEETQDPMEMILGSLMGPLHDAQSQFSSGLNNYRVCTMFSGLDEDLGYWVRPRSTTWFSRFLLEQYDDELWVQMFRMSKKSVFALSQLLKEHVHRHDTKYRIAIPALIRVACTLFKLTHGASLIICNEMFAVGKSTVSLFLRDVVHAINETLRNEITWPTGERLRQGQAAFKRLCGLPSIVKAIDGTHVHISKPKYVPADYYYFKSGGYTLNCQAVVDSEKQFLDLFLGMPGSTNDSRMLRRSSLHHLAMHNNLFDRQHSVDGFSPFLLGDSGYPLMPWLMVPHRGPGQLSVAEQLFNRRLRRGRCVVENAFGILKQTFRELLEKTHLDITFLPDVILCCALLHNVLLGQSHEEVEQLLNVLRTEGFDREVVDEEGGPGDGGVVHAHDAELERGTEVRRDLGIYLTMQRNQ